MSTKSYLIFVCCLLSNLIQAQDTAFKTSKSEIFTDEFRKSEIVLAEDDGKGGIVVVRSYEGGLFYSGVGYYFEQYDANLKLVKSQEYSMERPLTQKYSFVLGLFNTGTAIQIVEMYYDLEAKANVCILHSVNTTDFTATKKELFRLTVEEMEQYGYLNLRELALDKSYKLWKSNTFNNYFYYPQSSGYTFYSSNSAVAQKSFSSGLTLAVNEDKTAFGIGIDLAARKSETLKVYLFDSNFNKKTEQYFRPGLKDRKFHHQTLEVSKDGQSLFLLGKAYDEKSKKKEEGGKYEYELTRFNQTSQKTQSFNSGEHYVGSLKTLFLDDKLICVGFYSDRNDTRYKGICYFEIDPVTLGLKKWKYNPFTAQFLIDKYGKEKNKELKYLVFRRLLVSKNHDIIFNAEEVYSTTNSNGGFAMGGMGVGMSMAMGSSSTTYNFDDIISARINADGDLVWARNINKRQRSSDDEDSYSSYTSVIKDDETYFFINAADKIKKLSNDRIEFKDVRKNKSNLNAIHVNQNGDFDYQGILDDEQNEVPFMVSRGVVSDRSIYFLGRRGKKKQLLKIAL